MTIPDDAETAHAIGGLIDALGEYEERWLGPVGAFSAEGRSLDYATKDDVLSALRIVESLIEGGK